jgi:DNA-binding NtrC family response regulator
LNDLACDEMQGFFFSPPRAEFEFVKLLRADHRIKVQTYHPRSERVVLLVASDPVVLSTIHRILMHSGIRILSTTNPGQCFDMLSSSAAGVIICEQRMQEMTGTELLRRVKALHPTTVRIVLADYADLNSVFDAVNRGNVHKFLAKPLQDDLLIECIEDAFHLHEMESESQAFNRQLQNRVTLERNRERGNVLP